MEDSILFLKLQEKFGQSISSIDSVDEILTIVVDVSAIYSLVEELKNNLGFSFLTDLCGIHFPDQDLQLGVIYHLHNLPSNIKIRLKTFVSINKPDVPTLTLLFSSANWMERETYDFYGINFIGHPNLIRILNVEYLDFFPMRKEYPLEDPTRDDKDNRFFGR